MLKLSVREADELANLGSEMLRLESLKDQTDVLISGHINGFGFEVPRAQAIEAVNARLAAIHKRCGELGVELAPPGPTADSLFACGVWGVDGNAGPSGTEVRQNFIFSRTFDPTGQ